MNKSKNTLYRYVRCPDAAAAAELARSAMKAGQDELDNTLLIAVEKGDCILAKECLAVGADPNRKSLTDVTCLGYAIRKKDMEVVELLLSHGADPDLRTGLSTPVSESIYFRAWDILQRLLDQGANVNGTGSIKATPLQILVQRIGNAKLVRLLLKYGADVNALDAKGETALDRAILNRNQTVVRLIKAAGGKTGTELSPKRTVKSQKR